MEQLKQVMWKVGQALLPAHLVAQERSLLAQARHYSGFQGLPLHGVGTLKWDDARLQKGVISIHQIHITFPTGEIIDVPNNAMIPTFDLFKTEQTRVSLYLHLLKDFSEQEDFVEAGGDNESVLFAMHQLNLSTEPHLFSTKSCIKLAEFERDIEGTWKLKEEFIPPLISVMGNPFLTPTLNQITSRLRNLQKEFETETTTGQKFATRTIDTKICLREIAKVKRYLVNIEKGNLLHPYFFYEHLSQLLDTLSLIHADRGSLMPIPYQHDKLAHTFSNLLSLINDYEKDGSEEMKRLKFNKKEDTYLSEELPFALQNAKEVYLILQPVDVKIKPQIEGIKLAAYSRLSVVCQFALTGIELIRLESAPFNNNFSKFAYIFSVKRGIEWNFAINEKRMALAHRGDELELQAYLYWKNEDE